MLGFFDPTYILDPSTSQPQLSFPHAMDPLMPVIYLLPTHLTSDELRQWGDRAASIARVTQVVSEADFIVGKSTLPPFVQAAFLRNAQDDGLPHKPLGACTFRYKKQSLVSCSCSRQMIDIGFRSLPETSGPV